MTSSSTSVSERSFTDHGWSFIQGQRIDGEFHPSTEFAPGGTFHSVEGIESFFLGGVVRNRRIPFGLRVLENRERLAADGVHGFFWPHGRALSVLYLYQFLANKDFPVLRGRKTLACLLWNGCAHLYLSVVCDREQGHDVRGKDRPPEFYPAGTFFLVEGRQPR